jgi:hypothetical protein
MVGKKPVVVRDAGWNYDLDGQPGFEFSRTINLIRDAVLRETGFTLKRQPSEDLRCGAAKGRRTLPAYDRAIVDFRYALSRPVWACVARSAEVGELDGQGAGASQAGVARSRSHAL